MKTLIPKGTLYKQLGLGDTLGDIVESFNLDLTSNYGTLGVTRTKKVVDSDDSADIEIPVAFAFFEGNYYFLTDDFAYRGGNAPSDSFSKDTSGTPPSNAVETISDMKVFNGFLYATGNDNVFKRDSSTWTRPITSGLTNSPHLLEPFGERLYITEGFTKVLSISTGDALATSGTSTLDLGLSPDEWTITSVKSSLNSLFIGVLNVNDGTGLVYQWDGQTDNTPTNKIKLESGVVSGIVLNNIFYWIDVRGRLMNLNGNTPVEQARLFKKESLLFDGALDSSNIRYIHPNGMTVTDHGTILILLSNELAGSEQLKEDTIPSGIYEYDSQIGLYHKYSPSYSDVGGTVVTDYGQQQVRISDVGAIMFRRPTNPSTGDNGTLLFGSSFYSDATTIKYGVFCNDILNTTQKYGYFITSKQMAIDIIENWTDVVTSYKKLLDANDKIVLKYRTEETEATNIEITWSSTTVFTTTDDISDYDVGDEIQIIRGTGGGKLAHITAISESGGTYTVTLDETFSGVSGTAKARIDKWIKLSEISFNDVMQYKRTPFIEKKQSPFVQLKVGMQFTGDGRLYKQIVRGIEVK